MLSALMHEREIRGMMESVLCLSVIIECDIGGENCEFLFSVELRTSNATL